MARSSASSCLFVSWRVFVTHTTLKSDKCTGVSEKIRCSSKIPCKFPDKFANPQKSSIKCFIAFGFGRNPQNSLLIPCLNQQFADFGQNSTISRPNLKTPLLFSLFFMFVTGGMGRAVRKRTRSVPCSKYRRSCALTAASRPGPNARTAIRTSVLIVTERPSICLFHFGWRSSDNHSVAL
jgi:hypothetical protein